MFVKINEDIFHLSVIFKGTKDCKRIKREEEKEILLWLFFFLSPQISLVSIAEERSQED